MEENSQLAVDWVKGISESFTNSVGTVVSFIPTLVGALFLLILGFVLERLVSLGAIRLMQFVGIDRLLSRTAIQTLLERSGTHKRISKILGSIGFWIIFLLFVISTSETLGLTIISNALTGLAFYIPKVGIAILIVIIGLLAANFIRELIMMTCRLAGITQGTIVAQAFYVAAILLVVATAINESGIDTALLNNTIILLIAGLIAGAALSFGLGAKSAVANLLAAHYLQSVVHFGLHVKLGTIQGKVVAVTPVSNVLGTEEGRVVIPASHFNKTTAVISSPEG